MELDIAYQQALDYIFSHIDYSRTHLENIAAENFNLARMSELMALLGDAHLTYPTIHIAGTKGKGSVAALCAGALQAAGYKVGLYTSPDLGDFVERIQVNRIPVSHADFARLTNSVRSAVNAIPHITAYEIQTALAFQHFAENRVDAAVIEVGLGGRLDSTNIVQPLVGVITSLSMDHTAILGDTLAAIAGEKGGIIKPGTPVVTAPQVPEAAQVLARIAEERAAALIDAGQAVQVRVLQDDRHGQQLAFQYQELPPLEVTLKLLGAHQQQNAAVAYAALLQAQARLSIPDEAIQRGFAQTVWPGRFEIVNTEPPVVLDGAHNRDSAARLSQALVHYFPGQRRVILFGASADKDVAGMFAELLPGTDTLILIESSHPRAMSLAELDALAGDYPCKKVLQADISAALEAGLLAARSDGLLAATGSLYSLGEVRKAWFNRF